MVHLVTVPVRVRLSAPLVFHPRKPHCFLRISKKRGFLKAERKSDEVLVYFFTFPFFNDNLLSKVSKGKSAGSFLCGYSPLC